MSDDRPIAHDTPLGRLLDAHTTPDLPVDFADRILARTEDRPAPLPEPRRSEGGVKRWRAARRIGIATLAAGALGTAAAAAGLLDDLPIAIPSAEQVWDVLTGDESEPARARRPAPMTDSSNAEVENSSGAADPLGIEGPIDTPEELESIFERIDQFRSERKDTRRQNVDRRIDNAIERRRARGLPVPSAEEEERLRGRINRFRERRDAKADERIEERKEGLRERVEAGEELTREDILPAERPRDINPRIRERMQELRNLSPEERRERIREFRERRQQRLQQGEDPAEDDAALPPIEEPLPEEDQ